MPGKRRTDKPGTKFMGFRRKHGRAGVRNDLWVIPTTGCLDGPLRSLVASYSRQYWIDSVKLFSHGCGCSRLGRGERLWDAERVLASLAFNPNAAGVLIVGMGCEDFSVAGLMESIQNADPAGFAGNEGSVRSVSYRESSEEDILTELDRLGAGAPRTREVFPLSDLCVGVAARAGRCDISGGAPGSAEPGGFMAPLSDWLTGNKGTLILPASQDEAWRKGALEYGDRMKNTGGVRFAVAPSGIVAACTSLAANGAQIVICESDAPAPLSGPVPTIRLRSGPGAGVLRRQRRVRSEWIDLDVSGDAGPEGDPVDLLLAVAEGEATACERRGIFDIAIDSGGSWNFTA